MSCPQRTALLIVLGPFLLIATNVAQAQDKPLVPDRYEEKPRYVPHVAPESPAKAPVNSVVANRQLYDEIKPLPPVAIPDDPPPHEGAFFDLPLTVEPPDIILIEVLEALPGRPITGERLVRPDGTISLGFYGDLYVRGLTLTQVKVKLLLHLRKFINDQTLGLVIENWGPPGEVEMPKEEGIPVPMLPGRNPFELDKQPVPAPEVAPPVEKKPEPEAKPGENNRETRRPARPSRGGRPGMRRPRRPTPTSAQIPPAGERREPPPADRPPAPVPKADKEMIVVEPVQVEGQWTVIPPADSQRVFVDITNHNSRMYYVQGDVATPGRIAWTGKETVLDSLNYAGGFLPIAEQTDIHLYRPARGGKPAKDYKIDIQAIYKGVATANLQIFPNDRLIIGRNPIAAKTAELDRALSPINSMLNSMLQYSFTARSMAVMNNPPLAGTGGTGGIQIRLNGQNALEGIAEPKVMTQAQREALFKEWAEFFWSISSKEGGAMLDEKAFKEALMKKLTPVPDPK
jgi:protein involved in polysaccharide export with SLBB domain